MLIDELTENERAWSEKHQKSGEFAQVMHQDYEAHRFLSLSAFYSEEVRILEEARRYYLDVKQAEVFKATNFKFEGFPPLVFDSIYIEFSGQLKFDYCPPIFVDRVGHGKNPDGTPNLWPPTEERKALLPGYGNTEPLIDMTQLTGREKEHFVQVEGKRNTSYRAVGISVRRPPHEWHNLPPEDVICIHWYESPCYEGGQAGKSYYHYTVKFTRSSWPYMLNEEHHKTSPQHLRHGYRLMHMAVNLMYFLAAENVTIVRVTPRAYEANKLKGLPKTQKEYYILPMQVPRYKYLHERPDGATDRHVGYMFDVRGHFRHLNDERYTRNPDGSVRVIWIQPHQRGLGAGAYIPRVIVGQVGAQYLDYDEFVRQVERKLKNQAVMKRAV